jgi:molybdenum cofactor biosynthesis enzyme MoaA
MAAVPMSAIAALSSVQVDRTFEPEACPYETVIVDVTHRCNMTCANCYVPNRSIPDLDARWLSSILARLPAGRFVRLVGGEPTLRNDLPELIRDIRAKGHHPVIVSNGLKLADRAYLRSLKEAGLRIGYISMNGGFDDDLYDTIDEMRCAERKQRAFANLRAERVYTSVGMILVRGVNEHAVAPLLAASMQAHNVREFHLRSVGAMGRHMPTRPLSLHELRAVFASAAGIDAHSIVPHERTEWSFDFHHARLRVQLTVWPDLGSVTRGRLTPEGTIAPFMEHVIANEFGY